MELNRLRWASRRGMLELDLILLPFIEQHYAQLSVDQQQQFQHLMLSEDQDLFNWFLQRQSPEEPELLDIVNLVRSTMCPGHAL